MISWSFFELKHLNFAEGDIKTLNLLEYLLVRRK